LAGFTWKGFRAMWVASALLVLLWFVLKFLLHKGGYVHIFLVFGLTLAVIQFMAERKTRYHTSGR
jgi:Flp pilus assembly protein TadB